MCILTKLTFDEAAFHSNHWSLITSSREKLPASSDIRLFVQNVEQKQPNQALLLWLTDAPKTAKQLAENTHTFSLKPFYFTNHLSSDYLDWLSKHLFPGSTVQKGTSLPFSPSSLCYVEKLLITDKDDSLEITLNTFRPQAHRL